MRLERRKHRRYSRNHLTHRPRRPPAPRTVNQREDEMTPAEFKAARLRLGLSARALAEIYDVHLRTITRWESGACRLKSTDIMLMQRLIDGWRPPE